MLVPNDNVQHVLDAISQGPLQPGDCLTVHCTSEGRYNATVTRSRPGMGTLSDHRKRPPLGWKQKWVLQKLDEKGSWFAGCGWNHDGPIGTAKLLDTLVTRDLVRREHFTVGTSYWLTPAGQEIVARIKNKNP